MSTSSRSPRRICPVCGRDIAVVAGRLARHDPPPGVGHAQLTSCDGSRTRVGPGAAQPSLDGYVVPEFPGQMSLF